MPNHVRNTVTITGPRQQLEFFRQSVLGHTYDCVPSDWDADQLAQAHKDAVGKVPLARLSFHAIFPVPEHSLSQAFGAEGLQHGTGKEKEQHLRRLLAVQSVCPKSRYPTDNFTSAYTYCSGNWGTKWGAYDLTMGLDQRDAGKDKDFGFDLDKRRWSLQFDTAWSPPDGWFSGVLELFPDLKIRDKLSGEVDKRTTEYYGCSDSKGFKAPCTKDDTWEYWRHAVPVLGPWDYPEVRTVRSRKIATFYSHTNEAALPALTLQTDRRRKAYQHPLYEPWVYVDPWPCRYHQAVVRFRVDEPDLLDFKIPIKEFVQRAATLVGNVVGPAFGVTEIEATYVQMVQWPGYRVSLAFRFADPDSRDYSLGTDESFDTALREPHRRHCLRLFSLVTHLIWKHPQWLFNGYEMADNDLDASEVKPVLE